MFESPREFASSILAQLQLLESPDLSDDSCAALLTNQNLYSVAAKKPGRSVLQPSLGSRDMQLELHHSSLQDEGTTALAEGSEF